MGKGKIASRISREEIDPYIPSTVGDQVHINHESCPAGRDTKRRLYIKRTNYAILAYCHNCGGYRVSRTSKMLKPAELMERLVNAHVEDNERREEVALPEDMEYGPAMWPSDARAWLYKHHLNDMDIVKYKIGYSESWGRVILPVYEDGKCIFWQGRSVDGADPKYISVKSAKKPLFFATHSSGRAHHIAVVEDMLSAIRVARDSGSGDAVALLGTTLDDKDTERLMNYASGAVVMWLDDDVPGRTRSLELVRRLRTIGQGHVYHVVGKAQPKNLNKEEIRSVL